MNRSYSKIRHMQESNLILEKRLLSEQSDAAFDRRYGIHATTEKGIEHGIVHNMSH